MRALLLTALLAGCGARDPAEQLTACRNDACRQEHLPAAWDADPEGTWSLLLAVGDPLAQATLVSHLAAQRPGALEGRCDELLHKSSSKRCMRLTRRPHLRDRHRGSARKDPASQRAAPGPGSAELPLPVSPREVEGPSCPGLASSECAFVSAERWVLAEGLDGLEHALGLCARSEHGPDCVEHVLELAMPPVPPADALGPEAIEAALDTAESFVAAGGGGVASTLYEDWYWSVWTGTSFRSADAISGELFDLLPAAAWPQLRYAIADGVLRRWDPEAPVELAALEAAVREAMARRAPLPDTSGPALPATILQTRHTWSGEKPLERAVPAAFCMGATRRASHPDPDLDLRLAVLEALGRQPQPPPAAFFLGLAGSEELELLRWTGARIGAMLDPDAAIALGQQLGEAETPLVRARLAPRKGKPAN